MYCLSFSMLNREGENWPAHRLAQCRLKCQGRTFSPTQYIAVGWFMSSFKLRRLRVAKRGRARRKNNHEASGTTVSGMKRNPPDAGGGWGRARHVRVQSGREALFTWTAEILKSQIQFWIEYRIHLESWEENRHGFMLLEKIEWNLNSIFHLDSFYTCYIFLLLYLHGK